MLIAELREVTHRQKGTGKNGDVFHTFTVYHPEYDHIPTIVYGKLEVDGDELEGGRFLITRDISISKIDPNDLLQFGKDCVKIAKEALKRL